jgi:sulfonate transport system ATP-binding protein
MAKAALHALKTGGAPPPREVAVEAAPPAVRLRRFTRRFGDTEVLKGLDLDPAEGQDVAIPARRAVVFQDARLLPWKRVWRNVALGLGGSGARDRARAALTEVGLGHRLDVWPSTLSGGEAQRAALARALVREPELLLLDEPFAAVDALTRIRMHELVLSLWRAHRPAVLLVTHDVDEAVTLADRVLVLDEGRIVGEERIRLHRPREASGEFQAVRRRLLRHLGLDLPPAAVEAELIAFPSGEAVS